MARSSTGRRRARRRTIRDALDRFDETSAYQALERLFVDYAATTVIAEVLLPYLEDVGDRWASGEITVAQEHFASTFLHARLMTLARGWDHG